MPASAQLLAVFWFPDQETHPPGPCLSAHSTPPVRAPVSKFPLFETQQSCWLGASPADLDDKPTFK